METPPAGKEQRATVDHTLELLEKLDARGATIQRRAARFAWASTFLALLLLAAMSVTVYGLERRRKAAVADLTTLNSERELAKQDLEKLRATSKQLEKQIALQKEQVDGYIAMLKRFPPPQVLKVSKQLPEASAPPRVFLQIIDQGDRAEAEKRGAALREAGYLVLGVEYVSIGGPLKATEVRYYKAPDLPVAQKLADLLKAAGAESATTKYLKDQDKPDVKGNTFEIWFAKGLR